jgi:type II secretory pathway component PulF
MQPSRLRFRARLLADHYDGSFELAEAARAQKLPPEIVHLLRWEQRGAAFGEILRSWAELFARMSSGRSSVISAILAPFLMIGVGCVVGIIVIALFLPLIKLLNELS